MDFHTDPQKDPPPKKKSRRSDLIPYLETGWHVDQSIVVEDERLVVIRFGYDEDPDCLVQDKVLERIVDLVSNFAVIYLCNLDEVPDFNTMYGMSYLYPNSLICGPLADESMQNSTTL
jgi:hypothetical protein